MDKQIKEYTNPGKKNLIIVYILFLCGIVAPLLAIVGAFFAYVNKDVSDRFLSSHYIFLFRTFWLAFIGYIISTVTMIILIGFILYCIIAIWFLLRLAVGFKYLLNDWPHPNPETFWIK
ncbi:DUF4870 family protein [Rickettsia endosymbiont of Halotydeus destructor]|uniref:DUF4870 family protein n=1 Tax=Rickettsia endosymbiont of Halotydeus destructor TaxID=2996754 RepID=UPI003BAE4408